MRKLFLIIAAAIWLVSLMAQEPGDVFARTSFDQRLKPFYHGVASGDPLHDKVIIWTRITPEENDEPMTVNWEVSEFMNFSNIVRSGEFTTDRNRDFTVKIDVEGLRQNTWYFYRFEHEGIYSIIGRTRTAPLQSVDSLRFAVVSCSDYVEGYFHAYARISDRNDVDGVIHLGDYIYENAASGDLDRPHDPPKEIIDVGDYRQRYGQYRMDKDLRRVHQLYPFMNVWDDHETSNNSWSGGAEGHSEDSEGSWERRKTMALRAYDEWIPLRRDVDDDTLRIYRSMNWSDLLDIHMIDTRLIGRDKQVGQIFDFENADQIDNEDRFMIGEEQLEWLSDKMRTSKSQWQFIGQQVLMAPLEIPVIGPVNWDAWDGYRAERKRLYDVILNEGVENLVVLTGDIHTAWANNLKHENQRVGVEFVVPSVTKQNAPFDLDLAEDLIRGTNKHINYVRISGHGYYIIDVNRSRVQADYYFVGDIRDSTDHSERRDAGLLVEDKARKLSWARDAALPRASLSIEQPPAFPEVVSGVAPSIPSNITVIGVYPNPASDRLLIEAYFKKESTLNLKVVDMNGRQVIKTLEIPAFEGLNHIPLNIIDLTNGTYRILIESGGDNLLRTFIKL